MFITAKSPLQANPVFGSQISYWMHPEVLDEIITRGCWFFLRPLFIDEQKYREKQLFIYKNGEAEVYTSIFSNNDLLT